MDNPQEYSLPGSPHAIRIRWLAPNAVRITHALAGDGIPPDRPWLQHILLPQAALNPDAQRLEVSYGKDGVEICSPDGKIIAHEAGKIRQKKHGGVQFCLGMLPGESFYGFGEWFNAFQRRQGRLTLKSRESFSFLQGRQTYSAFPFFLSSRGYGFFLLNSHTTHWQIQARQGILRVKTQAPAIDYVVIYGPYFKQIIETYTALTGRPPLLPLWAFGLLTASYPQGDQQSVLRLVDEHTRHSIPLDAMILDYHWEERFHNFRWRKSLFPDPAALVEHLRAQGVHLGLIFTPFLNRRNQFMKKILLQLLANDIPTGHLFTDERALPEYAEAKAGGFLAHSDAEWWFGRGGMLDFTNPAACAWWNARLRPLYEQGVDFFKNDDGEYLPEKATSALGMAGREAHNLYGFYYGRAIYEGMQEMDERRPLVFGRSVWAGSQRYPAMFLGDQKPTFACIKRTQRAGLNLSLAGFAYWAADVFGLDGKTSEETHMRYAQWALFTPIARYFYRPAHIDDTRFPWSHGKRAEMSFKQYTELRYRLLPYYYWLAWQAWQTGLPIMRPMLLEFQDDERLVNVTDQVMLGENMLLAPVVQAGTRSRKILLPHGVWHDFWSTQTWQGPREIEYEAPLECLPILVRGGSILPMGPVMQHIPERHTFGRITLHCYPPYPVGAWLYEDDGRTRAYQSGAYRLTHVEIVQQPDGITLRIAPAQGKAEGLLQQRHIEILLHRIDEPSQMCVEGKAESTWQYDAQNARFRAEMGYSVDQGLSLEVKLSRHKFM